jgi:hypothetical protein
MTFGMPAGNHVARGEKTLETILYLDQFDKRFILRGK